MRFTSIEVNSFQLKPNALLSTFDWLFFGWFASVSSAKSLILSTHGTNSRTEMPIRRLSFEFCCELIYIERYITSTCFPSIFLFFFFDAEFWRTIVFFSKFTKFAEIKMNHGLCDRCGCKHERKTGSQHFKTKLMFAVAVVCCFLPTVRRKNGVQCGNAAQQNAKITNDKCHCIGFTLKIVGEHAIASD